MTAPAPRALIFGAGYCGQAIAENLLAKGWQVGGTTRSADNANMLRGEGLEPFLFDGSKIQHALREWLAGTTHLIGSIAPGKSGDPVLAALAGELADAAPALQWIGYLSTIGVYGDHGGKWIDEEAEPRPRNDRSKRRLAAEAAWAAATSAEVPLAIMRLSGIYGPGRNQLLKLVDGSAQRIVKPGQQFNRIHIADIAGAAIMLAQTRMGGIFNFSDNEPAPPQDVVAFAARLMNVEPPPEIAFEKATMSSMARSFYEDNKRILNAALEKAGYAFRFPDYRAGLSAMWQQGDWRGEQEGHR